nr:G protein [Parrot bornavirus 4]
MLHSTYSRFVFGTLVLGLWVQTYAIPALKCNTESTPSLIDLEIRRMCHNRTENVVSCSVSYRNHTFTELNVTHVSCYKYHCKTYWGFFGSYSTDKLISRFTGDSSQCINGSVEDPFVCNWYYCCSAIVNDVCRCSISNARVSVKSFPPFMYCSFADCSTVNEKDLSNGNATLSDGSLLLFDPYNLTHDVVNGTFNGTIYCNGSSKVVSFDVFRRSYGLKNCTYTDQSLNITCVNCSSHCPHRRRRRDLPEVTYLAHKLRPMLADAWEDCEILQSLILGSFGSGMSGASQFLREWLNHTDIVGYIVNGIGVIWQCQSVNVSFLPWNESTYYPPVDSNGTRLYLNDESRLQTGSPEAIPGLKRVMWYGRMYLGTVNSGQRPKRVKYNRSSHDYHLDEFDWNFNFTPTIALATGHETNPINHAFGTQSNLLPYAKSSNLTSTDTGSGWVHIGLPSFAFLNPMGWLRDIFSWAAWLGGILYLVQLTMSFPVLIARRRRLGRWSE